MAVNDLTPIGSKFNRYTVIGNPFRGKNKRWYVSCECECGTIKDVMCQSIVSGHIKSCGCFNKELKRKGNTTHGMSRTGAWKSYQYMITRCLNKNNHAYKNYGAKGVTICDRWLSGFELFYKDMGDRPNGYSLDRIDPKGNYSPENCRWADNHTQSNNKRLSRKVECNGVVKTISEWAEETGIDMATISERISNGWDIDKALSTNAEIGRNQYGDNGTGELVEFLGMQMTWKS